MMLMIKCKSTRVLKLDSEMADEMMEGKCLCWGDEVEILLQIGIKVISVM
jgi:hypothetical protein